MASLMFGLTAKDLWPTTVNLCIPAWALMMFAPRWRYTPMFTLVPAILHAVLYTIGIASVIISKDVPEANFMTFEGISTLFKDPNFVYLGWIHYSFSDLLLGRWILGDALAHGSTLEFHVLVMIPVLGLAMMLSPVGWLVYVALVKPLLTGKGTTKVKSG